MVNDDIGTLSGAPVNHTTVTIDSGQSSLWVNSLGLSGMNPDGDYTVNYKIVNNTTSNREVKQYGAAEAKNITDLEIDVSTLAGNYTVYVWLQKNNEIHSHEGTTPAYFNLTIQANLPDYGIALDQTGTFAFDTVAAGYAQAQEKNVTINNSGNGAIQNLRARLEGPDADSFTVSAVNAQGVFTVAPKIGLTPGSYSATVTATADWAQPQSFDVTFEVAEGLSLTANSLPGGVVNQPYTYNLSGDASGGMPPYDFELDSGSLPPGLSISGQELSGTPQQAGRFDFAVKVTDSILPTPQSATANYTLNISPEPPATLTLTAGNPPDGRVNTAYSWSLSGDVSGGTPPYNFELDSGSLPLGLSLSAGGMVSGTPQQEGTYPFRVAVTDSDVPARAATADYSITVHPADAPLPSTPPSVRPASLSLDLKNNPTGTVTLTLGMSGDGTPLATGATATSNNPDVATVPDGLQTGPVRITATGEGRATITFTFNDPDKTQGKVEVSVTNSSDPGPGPGPDPDPGPDPQPGGSSSGSAGDSYSGDSRSNSTAFTKTRIPDSAFTWDGQTLIIDHDGVTPPGNTPSAPRLSTTPARLPSL